jgi:hypothetical protein
VGEHGVLGVGENGHAVVGDHPAHLALRRLGRPRVAQQRDVLFVRHVLDRQEHVPRPRLDEAEVALGQPGVGPVDGVPDVDEVGQLQQVVPGLLEVGGIRLVDGGEAAPVQPDAQRVPVLVVETRDALEFGVPEDLPGVVHARDVGRNHVRPPADARGVGNVGGRVARSLVVEGIGELGPDVLLQVGEVFVVERLQQFARHVFWQVVLRGEEDVEAYLSRPELLRCLLRVVEGGDLDLGSELLGEAL